MITAYIERTKHNAHTNSILRFSCKLCTGLKRTHNTKLRTHEHAHKANSTYYNNFIT